LGQDDQLTTINFEIGGKTSKLWYVKGFLTKFHLYYGKTRLARYRNLSVVIIANFFKMYVKDVNAYQLTVTHR